MRKLEDEEEKEKENEERSPREGKKGKEKEIDSEGSVWKEEKDSPHEEKDSPHEERDSPHEEKEEEEEECPNYAAISVIRLLSLRCRQVSRNHRWVSYRLQAC
jgi:hypothetical protein